MALPTPIPNAPSPPQPTDSEDVFNTKAANWLAYEQSAWPIINLNVSWINTQIGVVDGYRQAAATSAGDAADSASAANTSKNAAQAAAAAAGSSAGLPSLVGNSRRALAVLANEQGVSFQTQIKLISIEPLSVTSAGGAISLDVGANGVFNLTLTAAATIAFSNLPTLSAAESMVILVRVTQGATAYTLAWPSGIVWVAPGGVAPATPNAGKRAEFILTIEGATIYGRKGASN